MLTITLRAARINRGFTLKEVGKKIGRCPETLGKYEADSTRMPRDMMEQLVNLYSVPKENIFFGRESVFTERFKNQNQASGT